MSEPGASLRAQAALSLVAVLGEGRSLKAVLSERLPVIADPRDRALLEAICFAALRHRRRYETVLAAWLARPLPKRDYGTHCLLLAGLAQLDEMGLSSYAAVAATAEAARHLDRASQVGLVNAILRRATREPWPEPRDLAERTSHPDWLLQALRKDWPAQADDIAIANNQQAPLWLRVNTTKISREAYRQKLLQDGAEASAPAFPAAALRLDGLRAPEILPGWREGEISVQDGAAQLAGEALPFAADARVLDACAAPGGKTAHLLEQAALDLLALDLKPSRCRRVTENLERLGLTADVKAADCARLDTWWDGRPFDAILADVPCTASGVVRRNPDAKWLRREADIASFAKAQARILDALWQTLVPGGKLLYATCSVFPEENSEQMARFLSRQPDAQSCHEEQILPDADHDGFFYCLLEKHG